MSGERALPRPRSFAVGDDPIVLDGGLATELEAQGADLSDALWSARLLVEEPDAIVRAHRAFFRAGARVATTASYQASFEGFARRGFDRAEAADLLRRSVALADEARSRTIAERVAAAEPSAQLFVAASIGPYGATLADGSEYRGRYGLTAHALEDFHRPRLTVLAESGADVLACETIPELEEVVALGRLLDDVGVAAWLSVSCSDGRRLRSGAPAEEAFAAAAESVGVVAVGVNCTAPEHVDELLARAASVTSKPLVVYPNSGEGWDPATRTWTNPDELAGRRTAQVDGRAAVRWAEAGARLIGGCCRVTPGDIGAMAEALGVR